MLTADNNKPRCPECGQPHHFRGDCELQGTPAYDSNQAGSTLRVTRGGTDVLCTTRTSTVSPNCRAHREVAKVSIDSGATMVTSANRYNVITRSSMNTTTIGTTTSNASTTPERATAPVVGHAPLDTGSQGFPFSITSHAKLTVMVDSGASQHSLGSNLLSDIKTFMHHYQDLQTQMQIEAAGVNVFPGWSRRVERACW